MAPTHSIIIPAYNEERRLPATLQAVAAHCAGRRGAAGESFEVLIVDDGSTDGTAGVEPPAGPANLRWRRLRNERNRGKGYSVRRGMLAATGAVRLFTDADLSFPMSEVPKLEAALAGGADVALGSRTRPELIQAREGRLRRIGGRAFNRLVRGVLELPYADTQCGFKLFTRACAEAVFARQTIEGWGFDPELLYLARQLGFTAVEVPVACAHAEGSKIRVVRDSARMFADVVAIRRAHGGPQAARSRRAAA